MDWFTYPLILVPAWVLTLLLDYLYTIDLSPRFVGRVLSVVFGRTAPHGLLYAALYSSTYFWMIWSGVSSVPTPGAFMFADPIFCFAYLVMLAFGFVLLPTVVAEPLVLYLLAGMAALIGETVLVGLFAALITGDVTESHRRNSLRNEIFASENPVEFLDQMIARAVGNEDNTKMNELLRDLNSLADVADSKGRIVREALERHGKHGFIANKK
jgi:hypothetical protein